MKITFHYYVIKYYQTQWTGNRMPYERGTDNRGSIVSRCWLQQNGMYFSNDFSAWLLEYFEKLFTLLSLALFIGSTICFLLNLHIICLPVTTLLHDS